LYSRYLDVGIYGVVAVALTILGYLQYLDGGFRTTTNREILGNPSHENKLRLIRFSQTFYSILCLVVLPVALIAMTAYWLTPKVAGSGAPLMFFLAVGATMTVSFLGWAQIGLLVGLGAQTSFFMLNALNSSAMLASLWICLGQGAGIWAFPLSTLGGLAVCYPTGLWLIRRKEPHLQIICFQAGAEFWRQFKLIGQDAWPCFRLQVGVFFLFTLDVVLVGLLCRSAQDAAIYAVLSRLLAMMRSFLQAAGEVAWPMVAQMDGDEHAFAAFLLRSGGWLAGSTLGALAFTLSVFLGYYMGPAWTPSHLLVNLLAARALVTTVSSAASYLLIGRGAFGTVARYVQRELAAAVFLGSVLAPRFGMNGIAFGFLASTTLGTLGPMFFAYGKAVRTSGGQLMWQAWWRAGVGFAASATVAVLLLPMARSAWQTFAVAAAAALTALACGAVICGFRLVRARESCFLRLKLSEVLANI
jgi:O-antigen/teichoic acid export membrane protein